MRKTALLALLLPLVLAPGCPARKFEITMERTPDGKVQRGLTIWTEENGNVSAPSEDVLAAARAAYAGAGAPDGEKQRFSGVFAEALPADLVHEGLGNHGLFGVSHSRMGSVYTYVERMPGQPNLVELFRVGEHFADTLVRALTTYARQHLELQNEPEKLTRLETFLQTEFRDDVLNLLLMGWQVAIRMRAVADIGIEPPEDHQESFFYVEAARAVNYLVERGYLRADEIPGLLEDEMARVIQHGVLRKIAVVLGHPADGPWPPALAKLDDPDELEHVLKAAGNSIGMTDEEFGQLLEPVMPSFLGAGTSGRVVWHCAIEPTYTNGTWQPDKGELQWDAEGREGCDPPQMLFAVWAEPDEAFQKEHLGRVMLDGERLAKYGGWRAGLSATQRSEWDAFLASLRPDKDVLEKLKQFRFSTPTTTPSTMPAETEPTRGAKLILGE
jgi:hypothetical protein